MSLQAKEEEMLSIEELQRNQQRMRQRYTLGWGKEYPGLQIVCVADLLRGVEVKMPPHYGTFKQARRVQSPQTAIEQATLEFQS